MKQTQITVGNKFQKIDFNLVKERFSLSRFCRDEGLQVMRGGSQTFVVCCPFHPEDTASCHIFDDRRFTCFGCGAKGTIIDFVLKLKPYLGSSPAAAANYLIEQRDTGRSTDYSLNSPVRQTRFQATAPAVYSLKIDKAKALAIVPETLTAIKEQLFDPRYALAREYAKNRGWLTTAAAEGFFPLGAMMAGEGKSFLGTEPALAFPKLIQTRRTATLFGLEQEFEEEGRVLCVGIKKRLLPETIRKWESRMRNIAGVEVQTDAPRWLCKTGFITEVPWEFDGNEDADVLVITEGPGDGLRLYKEAHADASMRTRWGNRWHITAVDACHTWTVNSMPRRPVSFGRERFNVSFFDGFSHVIILLDGDAPGRSGAENIVELARRQNPVAIVRNVVLPENQDLCDFFDTGGTMSDLAELFRATQPVK